MSKRVGVILAVGHTLLFLFFLLYLNLAVDDGQSRLLWALWLPIDFPISLLVPFILDAVPRDSEFRGIIISYLPHIIHGFWVLFGGSVLAWAPALSFLGSERAQGDERASEIVAEFGNS